MLWALLEPMSPWKLVRDELVTEHSNARPSWQLYLLNQSQNRRFLTNMSSEIVLYLDSRQVSEQWTSIFFAVQKNQKSKKFNRPAISIHTNIPIHTFIKYLPKLKKENSIPCFSCTRQEQYKILTSISQFERCLMLWIICFINSGIIQPVESHTFKLK